MASRVSTLSLFPLFVAGALACGGGNTLREVEPPGLPDEIPPDVKTLPKPSSDHMRPVIIDADVPAKVEEIEDFSAAFEGGETKGGTRAQIKTREICVTTPCVAELAYGAHFFRFSAITGGETKHSLGRMLVDDKKIVMRHALGGYETHTTRRTLGSVAQSVGIVSLIAGGVAIGTAAAINTANIDGADKVSGPAMTGGIVGASAGLVFLVGGIVLQAISDDVYQPGSTIQFEARPYLLRKNESVDPLADAGISPLILHPNDAGK